MDIDSDAPLMSSAESEYLPTPQEEFERFKQNKRPKFAYPQSERRRENTAAGSPPHKRPKPTPKPRPRPKPRKPTPLPVFEVVLPKFSSVRFSPHFLRTENRTDRIFSELNRTRIEPVRTGSTYSVRFQNRFEQANRTILYIKMLHITSSHGIA